MATGRVTTFAVGNHEGRLYNTSPVDTPFMSMLGGLYGGEPVMSIVIPWQEESLRDASERARTEGADAPTAEYRGRSPIHNVLQILQETVDISFTKQATAAMLDAIGSAHPEVSSAGLENPVRDEMSHQTDLTLVEVARDIEYCLLNGSFQEPTDNNTARKTKGIVEATSTNHLDVATGAVTGVSGEDSNDKIDSTAHGLSDGDKIQFTSLTGGSGLAINTTYYIVNKDTDDFELAASAGGATIDFGSDVTDADYEVVSDLDTADAEYLQQLLQTVWENGGIMESERALIMANGWNKRRLTKAFITDGNYREMSRTVGGVSVSTIITDFGELNVVLNRYMPKNTVEVVSLEECTLCWLMLANGEKVRMDPLALEGARERRQIYGEFGLRFGNELKHGKISGLATR